MTFRFITRPTCSFVDIDCSNNVHTCIGIRNAALTMHRKRYNNCCLDNRFVLPSATYACVRF